MKSLIIWSSSIDKALVARLFACVQHFLIGVSYSCQKAVHALSDESIFAYRLPNGAWHTTSISYEGSFPCLLAMVPPTSYGPISPKLRLVSCLIKAMLCITQFAMNAWHGTEWVKKTTTGLLSIFGSFFFYTRARKQ